MDEPTEQTGSCICCARRDPLPGLEPVCGVCRSKLANWLAEIPELCAELFSLGYVERDGTDPKVLYPAGHERAGEVVPHFDHPANVAPAGPINGASKAPRVNGSREAPVPIRIDATDLLMPARVPSILRAYPEWREDQVGYLAAATVLDGWCRDFADIRRETVPAPIVAAQCRWLGDRAAWTADEHPAVDEYMGEVSDLLMALRRSCGRTNPQREPCTGVPCRSCDLKTLFREPGSAYIECSSCGRLDTEDEYRAWTRLCAAAVRQAVQPAVLQEAKV